MLWDDESWAGDEVLGGDIHVDDERDGEEVHCANVHGDDVHCANVHGDDVHGDDVHGDGVHDDDDDDVQCGGTLPFLV